jgi:hypothetical protein
VPVAPGSGEITKPEPLPVRAFAFWSLMTRLLLARQQIRATAMRHFRRHADAFTQRGVWVDGFADVHSVCANFIGDSDLGSQDTAPLDNNEQLERGV